jgi:hypothetical protein
MLNTTDFARWSENTNLLPEWRGRSELASGLIPTGASVLDLGAGAMTLRDFLDPSNHYVPCDIVSRCDGCLVADLNSGEFPTGKFDVVVALGLFEYIHELRPLLEKIAQRSARLVFSYTVLASDSVAIREQAGWLSHHTESELQSALTATGWEPQYTRTISDGQLLMTCVRQTSNAGRTSSKPVIHVMMYENSNFGDKVGDLLLPSIVPSHATVKFGTFDPWLPPEGTPDLLIVGTGNSIWQPILTQELCQLIERAPKSIGIFGTQYRSQIDRVLMERLLSGLSHWFARYQEDAFYFGNRHSHITHLGDWVTQLCAITLATEGRLLDIGPTMPPEVGAEDIIRRIRRYQFVRSARLHPLVVALHSAEWISYAEQHEYGNGGSGKFRSLLLDVFGTTAEEGTWMRVDREQVIRYHADVRARVVGLREYVQSALQ